MKRYRYFVILAILIVFSIGTFYIGIQANVHKLPRFYLQYQSGDSQETNNIRLRSDFMSGANGLFTITSNGTVYDSELSFIKKLDTLYSDYADDMSELQEKYHRFMRGKNDLSSLYEDDDLLAYVDIPYSSLDGHFSHFDVAVLNKKNKNSSSFQIKIPQHENNSYIGILDVQKINDQLKIVTTSDNKIHIYDIDWNQRKIVSDKKILSASSDENEEQIECYKTGNETEFSQPSKYVLFTKIVNKETSQEDGSTMVEEQSRQLIVYNLETEQGKTLDLPKEFDSLFTGETQIFYNENFIYIALLKEKSLQVVTYNLNNHHLINDYMIPLKQHMGTSGSSFIMKNEKLYILDSGQDLQVIDLHTGKILYSGVLTNQGKNQNKRFTIEQMNIYLDMR